MSASWKISFPTRATGALSMLLGGTVLLGWLLDIPWLTHLSSDLGPMETRTALCFVLGGLTLLVNRVSSGKRISVVQRTAVWLIFLLAGISAVELLSGRDLGVNFQSMPWMTHFSTAGKMSPMASVGFLIFGIGTLANSPTGSTMTRILGRSMAALLLIAGLGYAIGYWLNLQYFFEPLYVKAGLTCICHWVSVCWKLPIWHEQEDR